MGNRLIIRWLVYQKVKCYGLGNVLNYCELFIGFCIVESMRILNINLKGMVNKIKKDCVIFY